MLFKYTLIIFYLAFLKRSFIICLCVCFYDTFYLRQLIYSLSQGRSHWNRRYIGKHFKIEKWIFELFFLLLLFFSPFSFLLIHFCFKINLLHCRKRYVCWTRVTRLGYPKRIAYSSRRAIFSIILAVQTTEFRLSLVLC